MISWTIRRILGERHSGDEVRSGHSRHEGEKFNGRICLMSRLSGVICVRVVTAEIREDWILDVSQFPLPCDQR